MRTKEQAKKYYQENRLKIRKQQDKYYKKNKEKLDAYYKEYTERNRDRISKRYKNWYEENREKILRLNRERGEIRRKESKKDFVDMYGGKCACCGETIFDFLTIDHIKGQVGVKKKECGPQAYRKATKEYRPDFYQILCYNCNCSKGKFGTCPHKRKLDNDTESS